MNKLDFIKYAYGSSSKEAIELCDENGWIKYVDYLITFPLDVNIKIVDEIVYKRPKILTGIEDNNGWFKMSEELPEDIENVFWLNFETHDWYVGSVCDSDFKSEDYTHWSPLNAKLPLF